MRLLRIEAGDTLSNKYQAVTAANGFYQFDTDELRINDDGSSAQYMRIVTPTDSADIDFQLLQDTITINQDAFTTANADVDALKQAQDMEVYLYDQGTKTLLSNNGTIAIREKGTGTLVDQLSVGADGKVSFIDLPVNANGYYFDFGATGYFGLAHEDLGFDTPTQIRQYADTVRAYMNLALMSDDGNCNSSRK